MVDARVPPKSTHNPSSRSGRNNGEKIRHVQGNVPEHFDPPLLICSDNGLNSSIASGQEDVLEDKCGMPVSEQSERVMEQMRRCVLIHHQLSCLLIHNAALRAGLYSRDDNLPTVGDEGTGKMEAFAESISDLGGSTSRLFSMALRDRNDLESMEGTLRGKVEELVQMMRGEYERANCNAEMSPLTTTQLLAMSRSTNPETAFAWTLEDSAGSEQCDLQSDIMRDCQQMSSQLAERQVCMAKLREELEGLRYADQTRHEEVINSTFDRVQRATERNAELAEVLAQLLSVHTTAQQPDPKVLLSDEVANPAPAPVGYLRHLDSPLIVRNVEEGGDMEPDGDISTFSSSEASRSFPTSNSAQAGCGVTDDHHSTSCRDNPQRVKPESVVEWKARARSSQSQSWSV